MIIRVETIVDGDAMNHFVMIEYATDIQTYKEKYSEIWDEWYAEIQECYGHHDMITKFIEILKKYNIDADDVANMVYDVVVGFKRNE